MACGRSLVLEFRQRNVVSLHRFGRSYFVGDFDYIAVSLEVVPADRLLLNGDKDRFGRGEMPNLRFVHHGIRDRGSSLLRLQDDHGRHYDRGAVTSSISERRFSSTRRRRSERVGGDRSPDGLFFETPTNGYSGARIWFYDDEFHSYDASTRRRK